MVHNRTGAQEAREGVDARGTTQNKCEATIHEGRRNNRVKVPQNGGDTSAQKDVAQHKTDGAHTTHTPMSVKVKVLSHTSGYCERASLAC